MKSESKMFNVMLPNSDFTSSYLDLFISVMLGCSISSLGHTHALLPHPAPSLVLEILLDPQPKFLLGLGTVIAGT